MKLILKGKLLTLAVFTVLSTVNLINFTNGSRIISDSEDPQPNNVRGARQDVEDVEEALSPDYGPVVSQFLGAVGSQTLNVSGVVKQAYGLVPNFFKDIFTYYLAQQQQQNSASIPARKPLKTSANSNNITTRSRPKITVNVSQKKLNDDQINNLEEELLKAAEEYKPVSGRNVEGKARGWVDDLVKILGGDNSTMMKAGGSMESSKNSPVVKGAMGAIAMLERYGLLKPITDFIEYEVDFLSTDSF